MRKLNIPFAALVAVLALGVASSSASAAELYVNSAPLKSKPAQTIGSVMYAAETEGITESVPITSGYLEVSGKTRLVCLKLRVVKGLMKAPNTATAQEAIFGGCEETLHTGCTLASPTITLLPLKGTASASTAPKAELSVTPQTGTLLSDIAYSSTNPNPCYKATEKLTGHFVIEFASGQTELATQIGTVNSVAGELELNGEPAFEKVGEGKFSVVSGHTFSFH